MAIPEPLLSQASPDSHPERSTPWPVSLPRLAVSLSPPARWIISIKDYRCLPGSEDHSRAWKRLLLHRVCLRIDGVQSHPSPNTYTTQNRNDHLDPFMGLPGGGGRGGRQSGNCQAGKPLVVRCCPLESELRVLPVLAGVRTPPQVTPCRIPQGSQTFSLRAPHSFWHPSLSLGWSQISFPDSSVSLGICDAGLTVPHSLCLPCSSVRNALFLLFRTTFKV